MRIDENRRNARASEHCGSRRAGKAAADDRNVSVPHGLSRLGNPYLRREKQINL
jgi:hypothetical protein